MKRNNSSNKVKKDIKTSSLKSVISREFLNNLKNIDPLFKHQAFEGFIKTLFSGLGYKISLGEELYKGVKYDEIDILLAKRNGSNIGIITLPVFDTIQKNRLTIFPLQEFITDFNKKMGVVLNKIIIMTPYDQEELCFDFESPNSNILELIGAKRMNALISEYHKRIK